jgi:hypothetical protein
LINLTLYPLLASSLRVWWLSRSVSWIFIATGCCRHRRFAHFGGIVETRPHSILPLELDARGFCSSFHGLKWHRRWLWRCPNSHRTHHHLTTTTRRSPAGWWLRTTTQRRPLLYIRCTPVHSRARGDRPRPRPRPRPPLHLTRLPLGVPPFLSRGHGRPRSRPALHPHPFASPLDVPSSVREGAAALVRRQQHLTSHNYSNMGTPKHDSPSITSTPTMSTTT